MTKHALVVGSQIEGLTGSDHDSRRMRDLLDDRGFAVELRQGEQATRAGILDGYDALIGRTAAGDAAVIYYSGHGLYSINSDLNDDLRIVQAIAPSDLRAGGDADFRGITAWELAIKLAQLTGVTRNVTVILDCCHAARMTRDAAVRDLVPRALPHPVHMGFRAHLRALERLYGQVPLAPAGNPDAVRLVACGQHEPAFEHTNPAGRRAGIFTEALLEILGHLGDAPISWAAISDAIRARVIRRYPLQRPEVEGPAERRVFSLAVDAPRGLVSVTVGPRPDDLCIHAGWITGVANGDRYRVMPLGVDPGDAARAIAMLRITGAGPMISVATREAWLAGHTALPDDAIAIPIEHHAPAQPVAVSAPAAERAALIAAIAATQTLRVVDGSEPGERDAVDAGDTMPAPIARLALAGGWLTIADAAGTLFPPARYPDDLGATIERLVDLGAAAQLRALAGEHGLAATAVEVTWGTVVAGAPRALPDHGAALGVGDRIYLTVRNVDLHRRHVHILNLGVRGTVSLLTKARDPAGIALDPGAHITLGEQPAGLVGLALTWPAGLPADRPRPDELLVVVTVQPISLRGLETHDHASALRAPLRQVRSLPASRPATPALDAFFVRRLSYALHPRGVRPT